MENLQISNKSFIFAAVIVLIIAAIAGCAATKIGLSCDENGCEFHADSIGIQQLFEFHK